MNVMKETCRFQHVRYLSTNDATKTEKKRVDDNEKDEGKKEESFAETLNRLSGNRGSGKTGDDGSKEMNETISKASNIFSSLTSAVGETWQELLDSSKGRSINKSIKGAGTKSKVGSDGSDDGPEATDYDGPAALMIVDEDLGAWEKMQKRLAEAPIIKGEENPVFCHMW